MLKITIALAALSLALLTAGAFSATADAGIRDMRSCGDVHYHPVMADAETTTCALARSVARSYMFACRDPKVGLPPYYLTGRSAKTGRRYTFRLVARTPLTYNGRAGNATLRMSYMPPHYC